jgi:hypothetical protein
LLILERKKKSSFFLWNKEFDVARVLSILYLAVPCMTTVSSLANIIGRAPSYFKKKKRKK